ncbi:MAG: PEGA domain-containing protein [Deltaproteobacteria bacterium]|nr:PEGA domain-containing protein [Deltaproteobacteria bacterium]
MRILAWPLLILAFVAGAAHADCPKTGRYSVKIDSAPQGAPIYIGDKTCQIGTTPYEGKLNKGDYTVIIDTPGYETATKTFHVAALRKQQELFVPLVKKADPPKVDIKADADPKGMAGATVLLDGEVKGNAPVTLTTTEGRHLVHIQKDGYEPYETWITATNNQTQTLLPQLKEIAKPKYGTVVVDSDVPDAEVYIDGNKHPDNTPAVIQNVVEGLHVIEVRKAPGLPWKQTVQVTANQQTKVRAELAATMNGGVGVVRVLSDAQGARAFIDGTDQGPVPVDIKDVKAGDHIIQVKAPGMQTGEKHVTVAAGSSQIVKFDLNQEAAGDQGTLKVVSMVPEAQVFIDGASVGKVPQEKKVSAGEHPVVVRLAGYKQFEQKVRVEAGQTVTVQATLKPVGRLRILSTPSQATVLINGLPVGKTPLDQEVETGETVVRIEQPGFQAFEQTITIEGGKTQTLSRELAVAGPSEAELLAQQRGLSSFGARTLPRGRSTVDLSVGYPYYGEGRVTVGAGKIANQFGFDATVGVRSMLARTELGLGARMMLADNEPFSAGVFTDLWYGSKLLDNSQRNGVTWDVGVLASLTAAEHVTITGRLYLDVWSDRHCPVEAKTGAATNNHGFDGDPIQVCIAYHENLLSAMDKAHVEALTGWSKPSDVFNRENGARVMASVISEIAIEQNWNAWGILEGAPFQSERALFTNQFAHSMFDTDYVLYLRLGLTYKF